MEITEELKNKEKATVATMMIDTTKTKKQKQQESGGGKNDSLEVSNYMLPGFNLYTPPNPSGNCFNNNSSQSYPLQLMYQQKLNNSGGGGAAGNIMLCTPSAYGANSQQSQQLI